MQTVIKGKRGDYRNIRRRRKTEEEEEEQEK
jgi:hypothetical protein